MPGIGGIAVAVEVERSTYDVLSFLSFGLLANKPPIYPWVVHGGPL